MECVQRSHHCASTLRSLSCATSYCPTAMSSLFHAFSWRPSHSIFYGNKCSMVLKHRGFMVFNLKRQEKCNHRVKPRQSPILFGSTDSALTETAKEELDKKTMHVNPAVGGDAIRSKFLKFFEARGHKILPSSSLVPEDPTVLLTIAGMLQFKPIFLGQARRLFRRVTTAQKCIRTNDVENVGRTARHHTFFEMLGNFSFGDYFKKEAILWAWELATKEFKLPSERIWISVFQDDEEAYNIWHEEVGIPESRIKHMGVKDNFWASGPTGPCGPCSEMYYDFFPERGDIGADLEDDARFIEFYNLVFMEYNRRDDGSLEPLQNKNIDTGMGLERMAQILQKVPNNYETDLIFPIIKTAEELAGVKYADSNERTKTYLKVIGDHMRAIVYLISDGVTPSNIGRGYVVRRLIRRVVRTGRLLGIKEDDKSNHDATFMPLLARTVIALSGNIDPDVKRNATRIFEELKREESRFVQTLERGEKLLEQLLSESVGKTDNKNGPCLSGRDVFILYDTYGFPVEITKEVAEENGVSVDMLGFEAEMQNQRQLSQAAYNAVKLSVGGGVSDMLNRVSRTEFLGYETLDCPATTLGLLVNGNPVSKAAKGDGVEIILDKTPFYAEAGGQIGDHGLISAQNGTENRGEVEIFDVQKAQGDLFMHRGLVKEGTIIVGEEVKATVDAELRQRAKVHHTATHLLQSALKRVLGKETSQSGSLVAFDRLRFDFNFSRSMSENEIMEVESLVNGWIAMAAPLETQIMSLADAKEAGAIAMFGEKYGDEVRVVEVPGISMELCGGTHVQNTAEIRGFKIISEQAIASGIRRIEAVAGDAFIAYMSCQDKIVKQLCSVLKVKSEDLPGRVENLLQELRSARNEITAVRTKMAILKASMIVDTVSVVGDAKGRILVASMDDFDADALKAAAEHLISVLADPTAIVLGSCPTVGKVSLVAAFSPTVVEKGLQAGKFIGSIAKLCGGGGGGRANFAQAGGREPDKLSHALRKAKEDLEAAFSRHV